MPKYKAGWAAWNYNGARNDRVNVTYYLNILQNFGLSVPNIFATLNPTDKQKEMMNKNGNKIYHIWDTTHPKFTSKSYEMIKLNKLDKIQCQRGISFAGAWTGYGFHRDGFLSGMKEAHRIVGKVYKPEPVIVEKGTSYWISFAVNLIHNFLVFALGVFYFVFGKK